MTSFRQYAELQADIQAHEAYLAGRRPLPHQPHDNRFFRMKQTNTSGECTVILVDTEDGTESEPFRVHYDEAEQQAWMARQRKHRS